MNAKRQIADVRPASGATASGAGGAARSISFQELGGSTEVLYRIKLLYQENSKIVAVFWEWRHKVMTFCFSVDTALVAVSGWMYVHAPGRLVAGPLGLAAVISLMCVFLEARSDKILTELYEFGEQLEHELDDGGGASFARIRRARPLRVVTYGHTLRITFLLVAGLLGILAGYFLHSPPH